MKRAITETEEKNKSGLRNLWLMEHRPVWCGRPWSCFCSEY